MKRLGKFDLPKNLVESYAMLAFQKIDQRGGFYYSSLGEWEAITNHFLEMLLPKIRTLETTDSALAAQEVEFVEKAMVNWRDKGLGTLLVADQQSLIRKNELQAKLLGSGLAALGRVYAGITKLWSGTDLEN
jgi:Fe-S cluster assembly ATPase SufC